MIHKCRLSAIQYFITSTMLYLHIFQILLLFVSVPSAILVPETPAPEIPAPETSDTIHRLEVLEQDNALLREQVFDLTQNYKSLLTDFETLKQEDRNVAFFAYLDNDMVNPANGVTVVFDEVVTNEGNSYDPTHGVFRAPVNGSYYINFVAAAPPDSDASHIMHLFVVNDNKRTSYCFLDHDTSVWTKCSANSLLHLTEGSRVWVEVQSVHGNHVLAGHRHSDDATHTHLSGFLIHSDVLPMWKCAS